MTNCLLDREQHRNVAQTQLKRLVQIIVSTVRCWMALYEGEIYPSLIAMTRQAMPYSSARSNKCANLRPSAIPTVQSHVATRKCHRTQCRFQDRARRDLTCREDAGTFLSPAVPQYKMLDCDRAKTQRPKQMTSVVFSGSCLTALKDHGLYCGQEDR